MVFILFRPFIGEQKKVQKFLNKEEFRVLKIEYKKKIQNNLSRHWSFHKNLSVY